MTNQMSALHKTSLVWKPWQSRTNN